MLLIRIVFIHFYSASHIMEHFRSTPNCIAVYTLKRYRQLRVKDLCKVPTWRLERDSNPRPFGRKATNLPMSHNTPFLICAPLNASGSRTSETEGSKFVPTFLNDLF